MSLKTGRSCVAFGCSMKKGTNLLSEVKLFCFPRDPKRREQWEIAVHRENWKANNSSQICNLHFISGRPSADPLHPDYVPSIFSFKRANPSSVDRYERHAKRVKTDASYSEGCNISVVQDFEPEVSVLVATKECSTMTDLTMNDIKALENQIEGYKSVVNLLQNSAKQSTYSKIMRNLKVFDFYTKLPEVLFFQSLLSLILSNWKPITKTSLEPAEQLLLVLMKLRLGLFNDDIAHRFEIGSGTVSQVFREWLSRMACVLSVYIRQPSRETIKNTLPRCFLEENLEDVTCVVDCSEVFIDRPFNLDARAQTYSNYKHHNTIKFLLACAPAGGISYISKAYGGRLTDKDITKKSGFLDTVKANDVILADRGFRIGELLAQRNGRIILPAFTRGKNQLPPYDLMKSRNISKARIHVERCIGQMKSYGIFKYQWPITFLNDKWMPINRKRCTADNILTVVAALCNISRNSIMKSEPNDY